MITEKIVLNNPERFSAPHCISKEKLNAAAEKAIDKLRENTKIFGKSFPQNEEDHHRYPRGINNNWICGMYTGLYWLAYELTGEKLFRETAEAHLPTYQKRIDEEIGMHDHDVGFAFSPSCVAEYKLTGNEAARRTALEAAEYFYNLSYSQKGGFILRLAKIQNVPGGCRTMMDTLMNIPLFFWAGNETGDRKYIDAAISQYKITEKYLIREDASSFHHYQFDVETHKPVKGLTFQGYSDESCWSRGHSWGIYGFPLAYSYTKDESLINLQRDITYFMFNHLPEDLIPYWDYTFTSGNEPRDSSAGAIAVCGMDEMCRYLPDDAPQKKIFKSAGSQMLEAIIDKCTDEPKEGADGILFHVTGARTMDIGIDSCAIYADYMYLEALMRYINPSWKKYW